MDRTFVLHCYRGKPEYDIKEVLVPAGNKRRQRLLNELLHLRKLLLLYRLVHYIDPLVDLEVGVEGRDKELCKPLLQLFYNSSVRYDIIVALQKLLDEKNERRQNTLESALYPIVRDLVKQKGSEVYVATLWQEITSGIHGNHDEKKPFQYETREHGILYYNMVTKMMVDKFGAKSKRKSDGAVLIFDKDKLERFASAYDVAYAEGSDKIRVKPIEEDDDNSSNTDSGQEEGQVKGTDANEGSEGSKERGDASGMKSRENGATDPVYNSGQEEHNKDTGVIPCAFCALLFPDEDEVISHMVTMHPQMGV